MKRVRVAEKRIRRDSVGHFSFPKRLKYVRVVCVFFFFVRLSFSLSLLLVIKRSGGISSSPLVFSTKRRSVTQKMLSSFLAVRSIFYRKMLPPFSLTPLFSRDHCELLLTSLSRSEVFRRRKYPVFFGGVLYKRDPGCVYAGTEKRVSRTIFF